jgi:hypothetical protein
LNMQARASWSTATPSSLKLKLRITMPGCRVRSSLFNEDQDYLEAKFCLCRKQGRCRS